MTFNSALLATATLAHLDALYNDFAAKPLRGFKDKPTALARVEKLAIETGRQAELVDGKVALVTPEAPKPAAQPETSDKPARATTGAPRGPKPTFAGTDVITVLAEKNPKRESSASHKRFALYHTGMTVDAFLDAAQKLQPEFGRGRWRGDLEWDVRYGFISVAPVAVPAAQAA